MSHESQPGVEVRRLLEAYRQGDEQAVDQMFELVYRDLRRVAHFQRAGLAVGETLNTTGLVHEVYLKVANSPSPIPAQDRDHFFNIAAQAMRQVLVDSARRRTAQKRGGGVRPETLSDNEQDLQNEAEMMIDLDRALGELAQVKPRPARVFECRYFAGLGLEEVASVVGVSARTVERDWEEAKTWLKSRLNRR